MIIFGTLVGAAILFVVLIPLIRSLIPNKEYRASTYGITDKEKSALVIQNTSYFNILDVIITGDATTQWNELVTAQKVYTISPGKYTVSIHYSDHTSLDNLGFMEWYVSSIASSDFEVAKGRAVVFILEGGHSSGMMYDPPDLVKK